MPGRVKHWETEKNCRNGEDGNDHGSNDRPRIRLHRKRQAARDKDVQYKKPKP